MIEPEMTDEDFIARKSEIEYQTHLAWCRDLLSKVVIKTEDDGEEPLESVK